MGERLAETERAKGVRTAGGGKGAGGNMVVPPASEPTLAELGITKRESAAAPRVRSEAAGKAETERHATRRTWAVWWTPPEQNPTSEHQFSGLGFHLRNNSQGANLPQP